MGLMMEKIKLKPCPFCGCKVKINDLTCGGVSFTQFEPISWIECCGFSNHAPHEKRGDLIDTWNRRAGDDK